MLRIAEDGSISSTDGNDTVTDFDWYDDQDVITFVVDNQGGYSASEIFDMLNAETTVTDNGNSTTISVGGATLEVNGMGAPSPFELGSLEEINDYTDGNYQYEAIDVVVYDNPVATA